VNIYVETNFVFELVFVQEQNASCEEILTLCELEKMHLVLPAYCLAEPHEKLIRQASERQKLQRILDDEVHQLSRSAAYQTRINSIQDLSTLLIERNREDQYLFQHYHERLLLNCKCIPLEAAILREAANYETLYGLSPQDAIVYASVISHLDQNTSETGCFLTRNSKDFDNPRITAELRK
jgi:predicted nucleic acid-binding protein